MINLSPIAPGTLCISSHPFPSPHPTSIHGGSGSVSFSCATNVRNLSVSTSKLACFILAASASARAAVTSAASAAFASARLFAFCSAACTRCRMDTITCCTARDSTPVASSAPAGSVLVDAAPVLVAAALFARLAAIFSCSSAVEESGVELVCRAVLPLVPGVAPPLVPGPPGVLYEYMLGKWSKNPKRGRFANGVLEVLFVFLACSTDGTKGLPKGRGQSRPGRLGVGID